MQQRQGFERPFLNPVAAESKRLKVPKFGHLGLLEIYWGTSLLPRFWTEGAGAWGTRGNLEPAMTLFGRYVFRQVTNAFLVILLTLTAIVWLATALRQLDLIISQGQGLLLFLKLTLLSLPTLMALIAPNAMLMASLYTLDRLNGDSELIVMTASGATIWRIGAALLALGAMVSIGILIANLFVNPASARILRGLVTQVRTDLISQVLQPGRFSSPEDGLTFHIRDRSMNGDLLGLLVHDERDPKRVTTYLAERGRILTNDDGVLSRDVRWQRPNLSADEAEQGARIVNFDQYMLDLSAFDPADDTGKALRPRERYLSELIHPDPNGCLCRPCAGPTPPRAARPLCHPPLPPALRLPGGRRSRPCPHHAREPLGPDHARLRRCRWLANHGLCGLQSGDPECLGAGPALWVSYGGDSHCGMDGAR